MEEIPEFGQEVLKPIGPEDDDHDLLNYVERPLEPYNRH